MKSHICSVFFDLDGTLIDTAPDLVFALNRVRLEHGKSVLPYQEARQLMTNGSTVLISKSFNLDASDPNFEGLRRKFIDYYGEKLQHRSYVFHPFRELMQRLNHHQIPWGIVTNKPEQFTLPVIRGLGVPVNENYVVSGNTAARAKPHPEPVLLLCQRMQLPPEQCLLIGDSNNDMLAGKQAGTVTALAHWGYIPRHENSAAWQADYRLDSPRECAALVTRLLLLK